MIDALWIAASAVAYFNPAGEEINIGFTIDRHACDDQPCVADVNLLDPARYDGRDNGS